MNFHNANARLFVPDGASDPLGRITLLGIGAHQDDLEFMAFHGILACYHSDTEWFGGVTCTDGGGSSRTGPYAKFTDLEMRKVRAREQEEAATVGRYGAMIQLDYPSRAIKSANDPALKEDLKRIIEISRPRTVYTHNPADKHETHVGVVIAALQAMRELPAELRPRFVYGCEVWRGLDWMPDEDKVVHDVSAHENLAAALSGVFDSQIAGGKRYDLATLGRRRANATFFEAHAADDARMISFAMDLTPLVANPELSIPDYVGGYISKFADDVREKLNKRLWLA
jgi:LmbE family N-acetylglucosaminyl deacetylase